MTTRLRFGICLAVVWVAVSARPAVGQDIILRYRWTKGEAFRYRTTVQTTATTSGTGLPDGSTEQTMNQVIRMIVDDVAADGTATLRQVIESLRVELNNPMGKTVFDSTTSPSTADASPFSQLLGTMYSGMIGESITVVSSPTGAIQKLEGMARLMASMLKNLPQAPTGPDVIENLKKTFSDDVMQDLSSRGFAQFPDRPLKPGDTWDDRFTASTGMTGVMTTTRTSTFQGVESRRGIPVAKITARQAMSASGTTTFDPFTFQMGEGAGESELFFDAARGRMQHITVRASQPMTMSGTVADGSTITLQTLTKTTMTLEILEP